VAGVRIIIYPKDHLPLHLHAKFAEHEPMISILTGDVLEGSLPNFNTVTVGGYTFGWSLDEIGNEIDFCPDATRILIETHNVEELAKCYRSSQSGAE
jgi:hypothetical protein